LQHPILYISHFFENHRQSYYMALDQSRKNIDGMIKWVSFFLDAVTATANNGIAVTQSIITYHKELSDSTIPAMGKRAPKATALLNQLFQTPVMDAKDIQNSLEYSAQATQKLLNDFTDNGILHEITGNRRNRIYVFEQYLKLIKMDND
ncbi:MAG: Fic family protein, partial [Proteobacteria bacterium]|nr:Fic family protein [Pseudomonadota bacterium]